MISFHTFGCKCNLYDSNNIAACLPKNIVIKENKLVAMIHVVNTCTVTASADAQARNLIRKLNKLNSNSLIIVTGCSVRNLHLMYQKVIDDLLMESSNKFVIADNFKEDISKFIFEKLETQKNILINSFTKQKNKIPRTRAFVKVNDGCNSYCSYCIIPFVRGSEKNRNISEIISEVQELEKNGVKEIVFTGINLGNYSNGVESLIQITLENTQNCRIRLSSLRPSKISNELIEMLKHERVCPHLHISLQSGSDQILKKMNRLDYKSQDFVDITKKVSNKLKHRNPFIAADVIVGFPGETENDFASTLNVTTNSYLNKLHVFVFNPRPKTKAYNMIPCPSLIVKKRRNTLLELSKRIYIDSLNNMKGKQVNVLWEKNFKGITENYYTVVNNSNMTKSDAISNCNITKVDTLRQVLMCC